MEKKTRRQYTPEEKVRLLRLHLLEGKPVSTICEEAGIHPTLFYQWQRTFFENGSAAFSSPRTGASGTENKIAALQDKLKRKDEVIAEIMEDFIQVKKELGES
jgi:transposase-like protein